jgi:hypothetical protein
LRKAKAHNGKADDVSRRQLGQSLTHIDLLSPAGGPEFGGATADAQNSGEIHDNRGHGLRMPASLLLDSFAPGDRVTVTFGRRWDTLAGPFVASTGRLKEKR